MASENCPLSSELFMVKLSFLSDILKYVNDFNKILQGKDISICILFFKLQEFI